jgi:peptidoglycan/LPS O-acetylase OafA/YrhL
MVHPYIANSINALVLIIAGVAAYFLSPSQPLMALLAPMLGILLLATTYHLKRHNRFVFHTVTALTLLAGFLLIVQIDPENFVWDARHVLILLMGISCFLAVFSYVASFLKERRLRNNTIYKDDL